MSRGSHEKRGRWYASSGPTAHRGVLLVQCPTCELPPPSRSAWLTVALEPQQLEWVSFSSAFPQLSMHSLEGLTLPVVFNIGLIPLHFAVQSAEQVHVVLLVDVHGFSTHIQVTKLAAAAEPASRPYTRPSSSQNKALMDHCIDEPYPNDSTALKLSHRLDIPQELTMKWF
ncbi:hypothetical protein DL98DRAFT_536126 [Cadophora sp. DSE1049]|nr:hypothetical protein DL98DRAFT_536126 [Cadophora sp. DSE1049]